MRSSIPTRQKRFRWRQANKGIWDGMASYKHLLLHMRRVYMLWSHELALFTTNECKKWLLAETVLPVRFTLVGRVCYAAAVVFSFLLLALGVLSFVPGYLPTHTAATHMAAKHPGSQSTMTACAWVGERRVLFLRFRSEHFTNTHTSCRRFPPSAREEMRSCEEALPGTPPGFLLVPHVDMYNCCLGIKYMSYHPQSAIPPGRLA